MAAFHVLTLTFAFLSLFLVATSIVAIWRICKRISESSPFSVVVTVEEASKPAAPQDSAWIEEQRKKLREKGMLPEKEGKENG